MAVNIRAADAPLVGGNGSGGAQLEFVAGGELPGYVIEPPCP